MAIRTLVNADTGVEMSDVATGSAGLVLRQSEGNEGVTPYQLGSTALTANTTLRGYQPGLYTVSGSTGDASRTVTMPLVTAAPGTLWVFRALSDQEHVLTASQEGNGTLAFNNRMVNAGTGANDAANSLTGARGSQLKLGSGRQGGASVVLLCDGAGFHVLNASGSVTIRGT